MEGKNISIHALREERDEFLMDQGRTTYVFQSTRSARSATVDIAQLRRDQIISIHALREERDTVNQLGHL